MELLNKNTEKLKDVWSSEEEKQNAKIVLITALMSVQELTMRDVQSFLDELDRILDVDNEESVKRADPAL